MTFAIHTRLDTLRYAPIHRIGILHVPYFFCMVHATCTIHFLYGTCSIPFSIQTQVKDRKRGKIRAGGEGRVEGRGGRKGGREDEEGGRETERDRERPEFIKAVAEARLSPIWLLESPMVLELVSAPSCPYITSSHHIITSSHHHIITSALSAPSCPYITSSHDYITSSHQHSLPPVVPTSHHHMITSHHHISTLCPQLSLRMRAHTYEVRRNHDVMQSCTQISQCMHMHCACDCFCMRQCACVLACFCVCICVCSCVHETLGGLESKRKRDKARASKNRSAPLRLKSV